MRTQQLPTALRRHAATYAPLVRDRETQFLLKALLGERARAADGEGAAFTPLALVGRLRRRSAELSVRAVPQLDRCPQART